MVLSAIILAKKESRRLPNKNWIDFAGKPMFLWNTEKCLEVFEKVYVSSDSEYILSLAKKKGAIPLKRPKELCGDTPNIPVFIYHLKDMNYPDVVVSVQANSPTISISIIEMSREIMISTGVKELMTCHPDYSIYGSVWAIQKRKLLSYKDFYNPTPEILIVDESVDIHTKEDLKKALCQHYHLS